MAYRSIVLFCSENETIHTDTSNFHITTYPVDDHIAVSRDFQGGFLCLFLFCFFKERHLCADGRDPVERKQRPQERGDGMECASGKGAGLVTVKKAGD